MPALTIAISPCPNDTFIFDALVHRRIDTEGIDFDLRFADVESLNEAAFRQQYDITKLSYHAYAFVSENYILSDSGSALGNNCGPLLIGQEVLTDVRLRTARIAVPGKYTTAHFLFSLKYPDCPNKTFIVFSGIEAGILSGQFDAGVIIHENRFTYAQKGLKKICDLGEYWESTFHAPIPLGGIAMKRSLEPTLQRKIEKLIRNSIAYAFENPDASKDFVKQHSQEMADDVIRQHINLYVNEYSLSLGQKGKQAVESLYRVARDHSLIPELAQPIFVS